MFCTYFVNKFLPTRIIYGPIDNLQILDMVLKSNDRL